VQVLQLCVRLRAVRRGLAAVGHAGQNHDGQPDEGSLLRLPPCCGPPRTRDRSRLRLWRQGNQLRPLFQLTWWFVIFKRSSPWCNKQVYREKKNLLLVFSCYLVQCPIQHIGHFTKGLTKNRYVHRTIADFQYRVNTKFRETVRNCFTQTYLQEI
jgi:hypothetical protein